jgi:hypothetical protein
VGSTPVFQLPALPSDGNYYLVFDPGVNKVSLAYTAGIVAVNSLTPGSTVSVGGGPILGNGSWPVARVIFSGQAGQYVTLTTGATRGFFYDENIYYLTSSQQVCVKSCGSGNHGGGAADWFGPLPVTGTYVIYLSFTSYLPSSATLGLWASIPLTVNSGPADVTTDLGQSHYSAFTFTKGTGAATFTATPTTCLEAWQLLNSTGAVVSSGTGSPAALGSSPAGSYVLIAQQGAPFSDHWTQNMQNCSVQLTSP